MSHKFADMVISPALVIAFKWLFLKIEGLLCLFSILSATRDWMGCV
ncbi:hypothetical protein SAMN05660479_02147 [Microbulbifer thermotolerans]|nr:hypothetical protein SAMN05660479_02147 [Microbulbifer thermotolerans]